MVNITRDTLDTNGAAEVLGVAPGTLGAWRSRGKGPKYHKVAGKVRYFKTDLQDYIAAEMNQTA